MPSIRTIAMDINIENTTVEFENVSRNLTNEANEILTVYDAHGAMLFTVATVCVYGLSIVAFIAGHTNRHEHTKEEESQIHHYLKYSEEIRQEGIKEDVLRLRSQLLADSVMSHMGVCESSRRQSRVQRAHLFIDANNGDNSNIANDDVMGSFNSSEHVDNYKQKRRRKMGLAVLPEELPFIDENCIKNSPTCENTVPNEYGMGDEVLHNINSNDLSRFSRQQDGFVI